LIPLALIAYAEGSRSQFAFFDTHLFNVVGKQLFSRRVLDVYSDVQVQVGPLHLLVNALVDRFARLVGLSSVGTLSVVVQLFYVVALVWTLRSFGLPRAASLMVAVVAVALTLPWTTFVTGHFAEGLIPYLWIWGARSAKDGKGTRAALVLASGGGLKLWGVLGFPLLLLLPDLRSRLRSYVLAGVIFVSFYLPFLVFGDFRMFSMTWPAYQSDQILSFWVTDGDRVTWALRVVQGLLVGAVGAGAVIIGRRSPSAIWAAPLAMVSIRVITDPVGYWYYSLPAQTIALVGIAVLLTKATRTSVFLAAGLYPVLFLNSLWVGVLTLVVALLACALRDNGSAALWGVSVLKGRWARAGAEP
jgi:hypothetical protein